MNEKAVTLPILNSCPIAPADRWFADAVAVINNSLEYLDGHPVADALPSPELRLAIAHRLEAIRRALLPLDRAMAERERAARVVNTMLTCWNLRQDARETKAAIYVLALGRLPVWSVEQACQDVARGLVEGLDPDFPPSTARVHQLAEAALAPLRKEAKRLDVCRAVTLKPHRQTAEERQRLGLKMLALKNELDREPEAVRTEKEIKRALQNREARKVAQRRVQAEYADIGIIPPRSPLALSVTARREMALRDDALASSTQE